MPSWLSGWIGYRLATAVGRALIGGDEGHAGRTPSSAPIRGRTEEEIRADEERFREDERRYDEEAQRLEQGRPRTGSRDE